MKTWFPAFFLVALTGGCADGPAADAPASSGSEPPAYYVRAGLGDDGDGSQSSPFASLSSATAVAEPGASIYVIASDEGIPWSIPFSTPTAGLTPVTVVPRATDRRSMPRNWRLSKTRSEFSRECARLSRD